MNHFSDIVETPDNLNPIEHPTHPLSCIVDKTDNGVPVPCVLAEARKKWCSLPQRELEWKSIRENWNLIWQDLATVLVPADDLRSRLKRVGAATTVQELGITPEELRMAYLHARDIRGRFTVLDFAHDIGLLHRLCDEVLSDSGVLGDPKFSLLARG